MSDVLDPSAAQLSKRIALLEAEGKTAGALLIRIDERTKIIIEEMKNLKENYVRKEEFDPVKRLVWGTLGIAGTALLGAIMSLVVKQ